MDKIINVTGGKGGNAFLVRGEIQTALVDCGMAYCAANLISNIKQVLQRRGLDYVLISHSHYDHIGAIPYLRKEWPGLKVLGAEHAQHILNRPNALRTIRDLSRQAAEFYHAEPVPDYDDEMLKVDNSIADENVLELGGLNIRVIETQGHTQCSLSFLVDNEILFSSESTGCMSKSGKIHPAFLTSSSAALKSVQRCQTINPRRIISPHFGWVNQENTPSYWTNCRLAIEEAKKFILGLFELGYNENRILDEYEKVFRDKDNRLEQPRIAFRLNTQNMIKAVLNNR